MHPPIILAAGIRLVTRTEDTASGACTYRPGVGSQDEGISFSGRPRLGPIRNVVLGGTTPKAEISRDYWTQTMELGRA